MKVEAVHSLVCLSIMRRPGISTRYHDKGTASPLFIQVLCSLLLYAKTPSFAYCCSAKPQYGRFP